MTIRVWITWNGDMACNICRSLNGQVEGNGWSMSGQPPENGWLQVGGNYGPPPLHDHCRCRIQEYQAPPVPGSPSMPPLQPPSFPLDPLSPTLPP